MERGIGKGERQREILIDGRRYRQTQTESERQGHEQIRDGKSTVRD